MTSKVRQPRTKLTMYLICHFRVAISSLGHLLRTPFASLMTIAVIGIAFALPLSFYVLLQNVQSLGGRWSNNSSQISVYLKTNLPEIRIQDLLRQLKANPEISALHYVSAQQGLNGFKKTLHSDKAIAALKFNPLPAVIIVQPILSLRTPLAISQLLNSLQKLPEVDSAQLNMQWLQRLYNIINLAERGVLALAFLLGLGILLIVGNTIRLATQSDREEISILKLVGATDAFVRRPFLYAGIWYGLFGGIIAWLLVIAAIAWLQTPATKLAASYNANFYLNGLNAKTAVLTLIISMALGLIGSWLAVSRSLKIHS